MRSSFKISVLFLFLLGQILSCSSKPTEKEIAAPAEPKKNGTNISIESKQLAVQQNAVSVIEIKFSKNKYQLSEENKKSITKLIHEVSSNPHVRKIAIIAWSDAEYPSEDQKELSAQQKELAEGRNQNIKSFIEKTLSKKIELLTYNMAERPTSFNEFIKSSEARIKKSLEVAGIPTTETNSPFPRKASKAVILAIIE